MKYLFVCIVGLGLLLGCKKEEAVDPALVDRKTPGEWSAAQVGAGGFGNADSFKNFQYTFEVGGANQVVSLTLTSATMDVQYALFNPLGQQIDISTKGRSVTKPYTLNAGKHRLVVMADRQAVGTFTLNTVGLNADPVRIESPVLQSGSQSWGPLGGGGRARTLKNHFYTFDVTDDNSTADIELFSAETDIAFTLYDALGQEVETTTGGRYQFLLKAVKKGTYTVMAATNVRAAVGNYQLNVFGKVANLKRVESQVVQSGIQTWGPLGGGGNVRTFKNHFYTVEVTEDNTPIDFAVESADVDVEMVIYNPLGQTIASDFFNSRNRFKVIILTKGTYTVMAATSMRGAVGNYQLNIFGKVANLKRVESQMLQSGTQDWGPLGGGGAVKSTKNHFYSFEVTEENSIVDLEIESADTETCLFLYNNLDVAITQQQGSRYLFRIIATRKGTYTVMAGTLSRGDAGKYSLRIFGKVANLQRIPSVSANAQGNWPTGRSFDTYSIQITDNNAPLDIDLSSPDTRVAIYLQNSGGTKVDQTYFPYKSIALPVENLPRGTYRIVVQTHNPIFDPGGSYSINLFGRFTDFKKL